jgi:hypothetical protein
MNACYTLLVRIDMKAGMEDKAEGRSVQGADETHHHVKVLSSKFGKSHGGRSFDVALSKYRSIC